MSNDVFPVFTGYPAFPIGKISNWATRMQRSVSGRTLRTSDYVNPIWNWTLTYPGLHDYPFCSPAINPGGSFLRPITEFRTIQDFFNSRAGAFDSFLFDDPSDDFITGQALPPVATDLTGTMFQLVRQWTSPTSGGFQEAIIAPNSISLVTIDGSPTSSYTLDPDTGVLTFSSPPGGSVAADFSYYFRVYFTDTLDAQQFLTNLWELKQVKLTSIVL